MKRRRLLPDTLFGRNVLLIVAIIVAAQIGAATAYFFLVQWPRVDNATRYAIQLAEGMHRALAAMEPAQSADYIRTVNAAGLTRIATGAPPVADDVRPSELMPRLMLERIEAQLPTGYLARWQQAPQRWLWFGTLVRGEMVWIGFSSDILITGVMPLLLAVLLVTGVLAFGGAYLIQRRINRPLQELVAATERMAHGQTPGALSEQAPQEIATLARSFNVMVKSLERADRDRALMLAGISHDLRTPLTKLRFALEYVGPHCEPDMRALMERNIAAADRIIDQFIDFARFGGEEPLQPVDLNALAAEVVASFDGQREPIALATAPLPNLRLRPTAVRRLISNLLRNAIDYAGTGVELVTAQSPQGFLLAVLDRGPGIRAEEIERLKQPFTRLEAARSGPGGSGLGLAIVDRVARLHGGSFDLLPRDGGGIEARVTLPLSAQQS